MKKTAKKTTKTKTTARKATAAKTSSAKVSAPKAKSGGKAPNIELSGLKGLVNLEKYKGKNLVLFFYPKDNTPGCTKEACDFAAAKAQFQKHNTVVVGVSPDSIESHVKFRDKFDLNFDLLSDPEKKAAMAFGAWGEKSMYGKKFMGIIRSTYLIDASGKIVKSWSKVKVDGHSDDVLSAVKDLT
jgi:peroxiredoxin Q/BCP